MYNSLYKYLIFNKKMVIPGIGSFTVEHIPGRLDFLNKQLHSPMSVIRFSMDKNAIPEKSVYEFLAEDLAISEIDAIKQFNDLSFYLKDELSKGREGALPGIGKLKKEFGESYSFHPEQSVKQYFPDTVAERVVRKDATHDVKVGESVRSSNEMKKRLQKDEEPDREVAVSNDSSAEPHHDKWWLYATILAIVALIALIYYFKVH